MTEHEHKTTDNPAFAYGWCYTDRKDGKDIRKWYRNKDYMKDEPYGALTQKMLRALGLPAPEDHEIFRGSHHDLLFLDSHGVVIRIGPTDVTDLINPGIIQPLGWIEDTENTVKRGGKDVPFTIAIYPGIELYENYLKDDNRPELAGHVRDILKATGQGTRDIGRKGNTGIVEILDGEGKNIAVEMLLDPDSNYNGSKAEDKKIKAQKLQERKALSDNMGTALEMTLRDAFQKAQDIDPWTRAFQLHQPLRNKFWNAFQAPDQPDVEKMQDFWNSCAAVTNNPQPMTMSHWTSALDADGKLIVKKTSCNVDAVVLKTPWTTKPVRGLKSKLRNGALGVLHKSVLNKVPRKKP